jgi:tetratricopeptide (TPR) repeat protein
VLGRPTTFVGRAMELDMLRAVSRAALGERMARMVLVTGEAGAGKSRLWHELVEELRGGEPPEVWVGRGDPMRASSPLAMLAHALRGALGVQPAGASHRSLRSRVADRGVGDADRVAAFLGELCGVPFPGERRPWLRDARSDPQRMADEIGQAFEALVAAVSANGPLLLVLEDLHSGDAASLRAIERAIAARPDQPFLVLAVGRPAARDLLSGRGLRTDVQEVRVGPLAGRDASALVRQVLGEDAPDATVARLVARSEGNPFFLEELIRAEADGRSGVVPDTVLAVVQARLAAMEPEARRVLRAASVFGDVFWGGGVSALLGGAPVADWIRSLCAREVIVRRSGSRLDPNEEHAFRHGLLREAAYAMLTEEDRVLGHRLAADWLLGAGERDAATLAGHFEKGGAAARAAEQYERAASDALERGDPARTLQHVARGIALGVSGTALGRLHGVAASAHRTVGRAEEALESAREAMLRIPEGDADHYRAGATLGWALAAIGGVDRLRRSANEMLAVTPAPGAIPAAVRAFAELAQHLASSGQLALAGTALARAEAALGSSGPSDSVLSGHVRSARGYYHVQRGEPGEAVSSYERAVVELDRGGSVLARLKARGSLASVYTSVGAFERAEQVLRDAIPLAEGCGFDGHDILLSLNLGRVLGRLGRMEEARARTTGAARLFEARGDRRMGAAAHVYAADVLRRSGELGTAEEHARAALALAATCPPVRVYALAIGATVLLDAGRAEEALCLAAQGVALLAQIGGAEEAEHLVRIAYARSLLLTGRTGDADRALAEACRHLHAQAATIRDADLRRSFLERVDEHARLLALASSRDVACC